MEINRKVSENTIYLYGDGREIMRIREDADENAMLFFVAGEMLSEVSTELEDEMIAGLSVRKNLCVDFKELTYIAGTGLRSLLKIQHIIDDRGEGEMVLVNINPELKKYFAESGFEELFDIR